MAQPRKFTEKMAIQQRKLKEDKEAFEEIMKEVSVFTKGVQQKTLGPPANAWPGGTSRPGGSLPNVCQPSKVNVPSQDMGVYPVEQHVPMHPSPRGRSPGAHPQAHYHPYRNPSPVHHSPTGQHSPNPSQCIVNPALPGSSGLLQLPENWRRAHSDPGIHGSLHSSGGSDTSSPLPGTSPQRSISGATPPMLDVRYHGVHQPVRQPSPSLPAGTVYIGPESQNYHSNYNMQAMSLSANAMCTSGQAPSNSLPDVPGTIPQGTHMQVGMCDVPYMIQACPSTDYGMANQYGDPYSNMQLHGMVVGCGDGGASQSQHPHHQQQRHSVQLPVQLPTDAHQQKPTQNVPGQGPLGTAYPPPEVRSAPNSPVGVAEGPYHQATGNNSPQSPYSRLQLATECLTLQQHSPQQHSQFVQHSPSQAQGSEKMPSNRQPIPDIIFTDTAADAINAMLATDAQLHAHASNSSQQRGIVDMGLFSSDYEDLKGSLDNLDLEALHSLGSGQDLNIDAATEDALRH